MKSVFKKSVIITAFALALAVQHNQTASASCSAPNDSSSTVIAPGVDVGDGDEDEDDIFATIEHPLIKTTSPDTLRPYTPSGVAVKDSRRSSSLYIIYKGKKYLRK